MLTGTSFGFSAILLIFAALSDRRFFRLRQHGTDLCSCVAFVRSAQKRNTKEDEVSLCWRSNEILR
jgi:hypothetical protein